MHICSECRRQFATDEAYIKHRCRVTLFTPKDADHFGDHYKLIQQSAIKRGTIRAEEEAQPEEE